MHNSAIFDANFSSGVSKALKKQIKQDLGLSTFTCVFIEDYFILLIWTLNILKFDTVVLNNYINQFNEIVERFDVPSIIVIFSLRLSVQIEKHRFNN